MPRDEGATREYMICYSLTSLESKLGFPHYLADVLKCIASMVDNSGHTHSAFLQFLLCPKYQHYGLNKNSAIGLYSCASLDAVKEAVADLSVPSTSPGPESLLSNLHSTSSSSPSTSSSSFSKSASEMPSASSTYTPHLKLIMELSYYCSRFGDSSKNCNEEIKSADPDLDKNFPRKKLLTLITFILFDIAGITIADLTIHGSGPALSLGLPTPMSVHDRSNYREIIRRCWVGILGCQQDAPAFDRFFKRIFEPTAKIASMPHFVCIYFLRNYTLD